MDCFHQINKHKILHHFTKPKRSHSRKTDDSKEKNVSYISLLERHAELPPSDISSMWSRETADHTDLTQVGYEHSTQRSAKYMDKESKINTNKK